MKHTKFFKSVLCLMLALSMILGCSVLFSGCVQISDSENLTPEQYLQKLESENLAKLANALGKVTDNMNGASVPELGKTRISATITVNDILLDNLASSLGGNVDLSFLSPLKFSIESDMSGEMNRMRLLMALKGQDVISLNVLMNTAQQLIYAGSPELSDTWIEFDGGSMLEQGNLPSNIFVSSPDMIADLLSAMPDNETITALLGRYSGIILGCIKNVEQSTTVLEAEGISQEVKQLTVTVYHEEVVNLLKLLLATAKADIQLKAVIDQLGAALNENQDLYSQFQNAIDAAQDDLNSIDEFEKEPLLITTYVDGNDTIIGRKIAMKDETKGGICFYTVTNGSNIATMFASEQEDGEKMTFSGTGTNQDGKLFGEYKLHYNDGEFLDVDYLKVSLKNFDDQGGTVNVKPSAEMLQALGMDMNLSFFTYQITFTDHSLDLSVVNDGTMMLGIQIDMDNDTDGLDFDVPESTVDAMDSTAMQQWASNLNLDALADKLRQLGAGSLLDKIKELMNQDTQTQGPGFTTESIG